MTLLEAIQLCGDNWFRPAGWREIAFSRTNGLIWMENFKEDELGLSGIYRVVDLTGDWEIVTPEQVMGERK